MTKSLDPQFAKRLIKDARESAEQAVADAGDAGVDAQYAYAVALADQLEAALSEISRLRKEVTRSQDDVSALDKDAREKIFGASHYGQYVRRIPFSGGMADVPWDDAYPPTIVMVRLEFDDGDIATVRLDVGKWAFIDEIRAMPGRVHAMEVAAEICRVLHKCA
jgi:hypothetical protein